MKSFLLLLTLLWAAVPAMAQFGGSEVTAELLSEQKAIAPGEGFTLAVKITHEVGWHSYWKNSGNIQLPIEITWELPQGFQAGEIEWPTPHHGMQQQGEAKFYAYYYGDTIYLLTKVTPPTDLALGNSVEIKAKARIQYCDDKSCKMANSDLKISLPVAAKSVVDTALSAELAKYRAANFPKQARDWDIKAYAKTTGFELVLQPKGGEANAALTSAYFLSEDKQVDGQAPQKLEREGDRFLLKLAKNPDYEGQAKKTLSGLLVSEEGLLKSASGTVKAFEIAPAPEFRADAVPFGKLLSIAGLAFIGGMILNLMPCVFPVIGIKIFGFVNQAGDEKRKVLLHGLVYTFGILLSFWVLSGIVFLLRSKGQQVGWGFQLQNPWFVYCLLLLMLAFALNMFGLFEIGGKLVGVGSELTTKKGYSGSFFSGVLATVVATPCSAPFLATALGAVITMPAVPFFAVFTCIALGLALPYLVLSAMPALVNKLPRPGPWMEGFKQAMSFLLFGTAAYLVWVYAGQIEEGNLLYCLLGLAVFAVGFWIHGRWNTPVKEGRTRVIAGVLALLFVICGVVMGYPKKEVLQWQPWSKDLVEELVGEGRPVYIDFTARWCATCQTNKLSYKSPEVRKAIEEKQIVLLKADWTNQDPEITKALAGYGRSAIPVNVLYIPGEDKPTVLANLLTPGVLLEQFNRVPPPKQ